MAKSVDYIIYGNMHQRKLDAAAGIMRAITHPLRMKIIAFIDKHKTVSVNKIFSSLNLEQSVASQHLKILRMANIVSTRREGKFIYYSVNYKSIQLINSIIDKYKIK
ncbi:MAG: ArsR/SmtB family transcription factor [Chitinophagales bacterium]